MDRPPQVADTQGDVEDGTKIVLFGGSFNPPHVAHLLAGAFLLATRDCALWLMPCARHPFGKRLAPFSDRTEMCRLLATDLGPRASVCTIEAELEGDGRTIDTVRELLRRFPGYRFRLALGADVLHERHQWKEWDELVRLASPIFFGREGYEPPAGFEVEITLPRISSTEIRRRLAAGEPVDRLVPRNVLRYIRERGLYR